MVSLTKLKTLTHKCRLGGNMKKKKEKAKWKKEETNLRKLMKAYKLCSQALLGIESENHHQIRNRIKNKRKIND